MRYLLLFAMTSFCSATGLIEIVEQAKDNAWAWKAQHDLMLSEQEIPSIVLANNLPSFAVRATQQSYTSYTDDPAALAAGTASVGGDQSVINASLNIPLFAYKAVQAYYAAEAKADADRDEYFLFQQAFILDVVKRYFAVLKADKALFLTHKNVAMNTKLVSDVELKFNVGLLSMTDLAAAKAGLDKALADKIQAEYNLSVSKQKLAELLGKQPTVLSDIELYAPLTLPQLDRAAAPNATISKFQKLLVAAERTLDSAAGGFYPNLIGSINYNYTPVNSNIQRSAAQFSAGLTLEWSAFDGGATAARYNMSCFAKQAAYAQLRQAMLDLEVTEKTLRQNLKTAEYKLQAQKQVLVSTQLYHDALLASFEVGQNTITDVLEAQQELLAQEQILYTLKYDTLVAHLQLSQLLSVDEQDALEILDTFLPQVWDWNKQEHISQA